MGLGLGQRIPWPGKASILSSAIEASTTWVPYPINHIQEQKEGTIISQFTDQESEWPDGPPEVANFRHHALGCLPPGYTAQREDWGKQTSRVVMKLKGEYLLGFREGTGVTLGKPRRVLQSFG